MSVYVAGCYNDLETICQAQSFFIYNGYTISYDWTERAERHLERTPANMGTDAQKDIDGVLDADWSVLIMTDADYVYRGTFAELGASLCRDIYRRLPRTIIVGSQTSYASDCCFWHHPGIFHANSLNEALNHMRMNE